METIFYRVPAALPRMLSLAFTRMIAICACAANAANPWAEISSSPAASVTNGGVRQAWPGGCSGVVVNRLNGDLIVKVVGYGLWHSSDRGESWQRIDHNTISGRDETGWATSVDQNDPRRIASFSLDGSAGWTVDGFHWKSFTDKGRNWDFGSVDWATPAPKTIIVAKHETTPPGEVNLTTDGGVTWTKLPIRLDENRAHTSMIGALDATTLVYGKNDGIYRSTDTGLTWAKVSSLTPQTRIPVLYKGVHYLGGASGLLVSRDLGASWQAQGATVSIWQGPFFGRDEKQMVVIGNDDVLKTKDAGSTWTRVAALKPKEKEFPFTANWFGCYTWDPVNDMVYASAMGNPVYRLKLESPADALSK